MKYTKEQRETAALVCAVAASSLPVAERYFDIMGLIGLNPPPLGKGVNPTLTLALEAWDYVRQATGLDWSQEQHAEAEALIRTGWTPGWTP